MASQRGKELPDDHFSKNGRDPQQICLKLTHGHCKCSSHTERCHDKIKPKALVATSQAYWSLSRELQSHLLRALLSAAKVEAEGTFTA